MLDRVAGHCNQTVTLDLMSEFKEVAKEVSRKFGVLLYLEGVYTGLRPEVAFWEYSVQAVLSPPAGDGVPQLVEEVARREE